MCSILLLVYAILLIGCGDFNVGTATLLPDPCPLPNKANQFRLNDRDRLVYAPMAGLGSLVIDKVHFVLTIDSSIFVNIG